MTAAATRDPYRTLDVGKNANRAAVKRAYIKKSKKHHPDAGGDAEEFKEVAWAYWVLRDSERRTAYDRNGEVERPPPDDREKVVKAIVDMYDQALKSESTFRSDVDLMDNMRKYTSERIKAIEDAVKKQHEGVANLRSLLGRVQYEGKKENLFEAMTLARIDGVSRVLATNEDLARISRMVLEELEDYESVVEMVQRTMTVWVTSTTVHNTDSTV